MPILSEISGLVVSCQATSGNPLDDSGALTLLARAAELGGASAIRVDGLANLTAMKPVIGVPLISILKRDVPGFDVRITPTFGDAARLVEAGAQVVAVDASLRSRPGPDNIATLLQRLKTELQLEVLADVDTLAAGLAAIEAGAAAIATTLSGYTRETADRNVGPDFGLVEELAAVATVPVIAEGRYTSASDVRAAIDAGAQAVVVGTAITDITAVTRALINEISVGEVAHR